MKSPSSRLVRQRARARGAVRHVRRSESIASGARATHSPPPGVGPFGPRRLHNEIARRKTAETTLLACRQNQRVMLLEAHVMQQQVRQLAHKVIRAQEEERKEISRELHDEIVQTLACVNVQLSALRMEARSASQEARRNISRTQRLVRKSVRIVYRFARELRPTMLDDLGLEAALQCFAHELAKRSGLAVQVKMTGALVELSEDARIVVYRVAQAALNNVAQHAGASRAKLEIRLERGMLGLEVTDNGASFDVSRAMRPHRNQRLGLVGMRERVEMLNGTFSVISTPGHGTTVRADIPHVAPRRATRR